MAEMDGKKAAAREKRSVAIRGNAKVEFLGRSVGYLFKLLGYTMRTRVVTEDGEPARILDGDRPCIVTLWHNSALIQLQGTRKLGFTRKAVILTSASKDGAALASFASVFGLGAVRGSSSRRARAVLVASLRALKEGVNVGITPDGPKGPVHVVQSGVIKLAQLSGAPIIVVRSRCQWVWRLKTWDRFRIPLPFGKVVFTVDEALDVPRELDEAGFEEIRSEIERRMRKGLDETEWDTNDAH